MEDSDSSSYDRITDTVVVQRNPDGSAVRRQGTPVWGVVAVQAPSISEQASDPARYVDIDLLPSLRPSDGTTWTMPENFKPNRNWVAQKVRLDSGAERREVTGEPTGEPTGANSNALGRVLEGINNPGAEDPR